MFSPRLPDTQALNRVTHALGRIRAAGRAVIDLTLSNPTIAGFEYPPSILDALASPGSLIYAPQPLGLPAARDAVARDYARRGISVACDRVVLTASTSEAYSVLFKLLCAPAGDAVLVPVPSYPLFDHLTRLDGVATIPYRLEYQGRWTLDTAHVDEAWRSSVRAVLAVTPNNPTGSALSGGELGMLSQRCAAGGAALVLDEVFADYPLKDAGNLTPADVVPECLTFRLGGLSKSAGLPQVKLGWLCADGPERLVRDALDRLEWICDTYLSVSTPVQHAAPHMIEAGACVRQQILARVRSNYAQLEKMAAARPAIELLPADGGWSCVLRVPAHVSEEDLVLQLLEEDGVLVHPGYFFDFAHEAFVVISLLPEPASFAEGMRRVLERADA